MTDFKRPKICVAPMMKWTDRHCRFFLRQLSSHCLLYTEMVTTGAILNGDPDWLLKFNPAEHPVALQLGGSGPEALASAARIGAGYGYDEINLNVGCPSDRVHSGRFGACLMAEPELVAACVAAMIEQVDVPVTVKTRIGINSQDSREFLQRLLEHVRTAGCRTVIIHARKAILGGLSPKENRSIPPLKYEAVYRVKQDFPDLEVILNGGITELDAAATHLESVDGVMLGREAYHNPYILAGVDARFYGATQQPPTRETIIRNMRPYIEMELAAGTALKHITRHLLGLYHGVPGARAWRRHLSQYATAGNAGIEVIEEALGTMNSIAVVSPAPANQNAHG
jgi:tRNA-dihydrouridine synthase A